MVMKNEKRKLIRINEFIDSINDYGKSKIELMKNLGFPESEIRKVKDEYEESIRLKLMTLEIDDGYIIVPENKIKKANREIILDLLLEIYDDE